MFQLDTAAQGVPKCQAFENIPRNRHLNHKYHAQKDICGISMANQRFRKCKLMPVILRFMWASFLVAAPMAAKAQDACVIKLGGGRVVPTVDWWLEPWETGSFDPSVPPGTVIYSKHVEAFGIGGFVQCNRTIGKTLYTVATSSESDGYSTFKTSIAGVGIRIRGGIKSGSWWPQSRYDDRTNYFLAEAEDFVVELVKTGPITTGGYIRGLIGESRYVDLQHTFRRISVLGGGIVVEPRVPTCKLNTPLVPVSLDSISVSDLMDNGKGPWKDFSLSLACAGGDIGASTRMFVVFSDSQNPDNRSTTLSLSKNSVAKNVGIEIQRENDQLVSFGPESGEANQWVVGEFGNEPVNIKLKARYTSTSLEPTPGSANADATFVMSYK
ncbi:fimbrial protein [Comamonas thiooxydans]|uniref:fimbrial protein n=1 Tax=Comamonas TaxID=283 RepID=UPI00209C0FC7|nr:type 1 fimbrial protein [Comamonas thiooxydans]